MNSIGKILTLTTFGESHGPAIGGVLDGMPAGVAVDAARVQAMLDRRRPGSAVGSGRREPDRLQLLSGIFEGRTLGTPIGFIIPNSDAHSADYEALRNLYRPGHADYTYQAKYGVRDHRGGGRASARETACRVVAGALAVQALEQLSVSVTARVAALGGVTDPTSAQIAEAISEVRADRDTLGGIVECVIGGLPAGVGEPVYGKLSARLAEAMMSIPAAHGFEYGDGFAMGAARGSEVVDSFVSDGNGGIVTAANHSGGIQGGISNGEPVIFRVAFKPIATMPRPLDTVAADGRHAVVDARGRHDVTAVVRALPVVEAMAALTALDLMLLGRASRL